MLLVQNLFLKADNLFYITIDGDGRILSANNSFLKHISPVPNATGSLFFRDCCLHASRHTLLEQVLHAPGNLHSVQLQHKKTDGEYITAKWNFLKASTEDSVLIQAVGTEAVGGISGVSSDAKLCQIEKEHTQLSKIMDYSLDIICTLDNEGKFTTVSEASRKIWGYKPQELLGKKWVDFVFPEDIERTIAATKETLQGKEIQIFENRFIKKDGSVVTMFWTGKWDSEDKTMYCVARDGTVRKMFEATIKASEEKYKLLFDKSPQPMWIYEEPQMLYRF